MKSSGESLRYLEAAGRNRLSLFRDTTIGTWNVRTMFQSGKAAQIAAEMQKYNIALLGISESRWAQSRQKRLISREMILFSDHEDAPHTEGVALMLSRSAQKALIGWESHGPRIIRAAFRTKQKKIKLNIVQCYAPTNDSDEEDKCKFYDRLQSVLDKCPGIDITIVIGDLNAKIGEDITGNEEVMGRHGLGEMSDNGERFTDFCALNGLVIGGSIFPHKRIHKVTWVSPDNSTEN